jgi:hypothetical protein
MFGVKTGACGARDAQRAACNAPTRRPDRSPSHAIAAIALVSLFLILAPNTVAALECVSAAPRDSRYWSWRQIDGRRCWYPGRPGLSKSKLYWPTASGVASVSKRTSGMAVPAAPVNPDADELLLNGVWPPLPPQDSFEERFVGTK